MQVVLALEATTNLDDECKWHPSTEVEANRLHYKPLNC